MTRKISNPKSKSALTAAQKELRRKEEEVRRRQMELEKRLKKLPEEIRAKQEQQRKLQRVEVTTVAIGEYRNRIHRQPGRPIPTQTSGRLLRRDRNQGKITFLILCMIFLIILVLLWRVMPT